MWFYMIVGNGGGEMDSVAGFEIPVDDMKRAQKFYADAFGWRVVATPGMEEEGGMLVTGEMDEDSRPTGVGYINGALSPREEPDAGVQLGVEVASMDAAVKRIEAAGGEVVVPKVDMGGYGWYARFRDTEGNLISLWEPAPMEEESAEAAGSTAGAGGEGAMMNAVTHFEIPVDDFKRAQEFYADAFDWTNSAPPGMEGRYEMLMTTEVGETYRPTRPGRINGALYPRENPDADVMITVEVPSVDEALDRVEAAGGEVVMPKMDFGGHGWYARFRDTEGNIVSLWRANE
jgi:predicted enzyme related to lactoylglutathione lyase